MIEATDLKIGNILVWHNNNMNTDEYVQVAYIYKDYVGVSHLNSKGTWLVYYTDKTISFPNNPIDRIKRIYRENMLKAVLLSCKFTAMHITDEYKKKLMYEVNYVNADFEKYKAMVKDFKL